MGGSLSQGGEHVVGDNVVLGEVLRSPLAGVGKGGSLGLLEAVVLSGEGGSSVVVAVTREKSP